MHRCPWCSKGCTPIPTGPSGAEPQAGDYHRLPMRPGRKSNVRKADKPLPHQWHLGRWYCPGGPADSAGRAGRLARWPTGACRRARLCSRPLTAGRLQTHGDTCTARRGLQLQFAGGCEQGGSARARLSGKGNQITGEVPWPGQAPPGSGRRRHQPIEVYLGCKNNLCRPNCRRVRLATSLVAYENHVGDHKRLSARKRRVGSGPTSSTSAA